MSYSGPSLRASRNIAIAFGILALAPAAARAQAGPGTTPNTEFPFAPPTGFPDAGYPPTAYPATEFPTSGFPTTGLPSTGLPSTGLPTTGLPTTGYPTTGFPTTGVPFNPFGGITGTTPPSSGSSTGTSTATSLAAYNVNPNTVTVAGISSGGFMAVQMQVAYSTRIFGTAVFAGGPYYCAQASEATATGQCESGSGISSTGAVSYTNQQNGNGTIDPTSNIANKPIYMFSGTEDTTVHQAVMNALSQYYLSYTTSGNITYNNNTPAEHGWVSPYGPNSCASSYMPYINNCSIDPEQTFLTMFYGALQAKATTLGGSYVQFDQTPFIPGGNAAAVSMDTTGWLYVPASCASGTACRLVVTLHGCLQYQGVVQQQFVDNSGINEWADTNNIIVLYPQATSTSSTNPLGCWDWWGYTGADYAVKSAPQMTAIMAMVSKITSGQH
jgi:poly(3-hydroxybutyrate) depolymerase